MMDRVVVAEMQLQGTSSQLLFGIFCYRGDVLSDCSWWGHLTVWSYKRFCREGLLLRVRSFSFLKRWLCLFWWWGYVKVEADWPCWSVGLKVGLGFFRRVLVGGCWRCGGVGCWWGTSRELRADLWTFENWIIAIWWERCRAHSIRFLSLGMKVE